MDVEPNNVDRQGFAFEYLRERAGRAHAEGDGVLANSLSALALSQIEQLGKQGGPKINLGSVRWAYILPLYWLIDDYMLGAVERALKVHFRPDSTNESFLKLLEAYHFLVNQPLAPIQQQVEVFTSLDFGLLGDKNAFESIVLLEHAVELVWFRGPDQVSWNSLLDTWIPRSPDWCRQRLVNLKTRLLLQTRLTCPTKSIRRISSDDPTASSGDLRLAPLWIHLLNCEGKRLDEAVEQIGAGVSPVSHVARLLFDFHHKNRARGEFGEPQEVGLTRRRQFNTTSPLMVFNELRDAELSECLGKLFRKARIGEAAERFHAFRLAMLSELNALRLWNFGGWQSAINAQSEAALEATKWENTPSAIGMAADGILKAVQCTTYKQQKDDSLIRTAVSRLEFADAAILSSLIEKLIAVYPLQEYAAQHALEDLSDLVPSKLWDRLAQWGVQFTENVERRKTSGWTLQPLAYLADIILYADTTHSFWTQLLPEILKMARNPLIWHDSSNELLRAWIMKAPPDMAREAGLAMISIDTDDQVARSNRIGLLRNAETSRADLKNVFLPELRRKANSTAENVLLDDSSDPQLRQQAKNLLLENIDSLIAQAVPAPGTTTFSLGSPPPLSFESTDWNDDDKSVLDRLIAAVDNPAVLSFQISQLLIYIQLLIHAAPPSFAAHLLPRFESWVEKPPVGQNPVKPMRGPFSSAQINWGQDSSGQITMMLGWIGFQLLQKIGQPAADPIGRWIHNSVLNPEQQAIPIMIYMGIPAAVYLPKGPRTDLLAACQTLLANLLLRHKHEPEYGVTLANSFSYLGYLFRKEENPLIDWNAGNARESLDLLLPKLSLALMEGSKSVNPDVRASVARFILLLGEWITLPPYLQEVFSKLKTDNRARVRAATVPSPRPN